MTFIASEFEVWRTITLAAKPRSSVDFRNALSRNGIRIGKWGIELLDKLVCVPLAESKDVRLARCTLAQLGFPKGAFRGQFYDRALKMGLRFCPPAIGPELRLQYRDQAEGERLFIAMEAIVVACGQPTVFCITSDVDGLDLHGFSGARNGFISAKECWVFEVPHD